MEPTELRAEMLVAKKLPAKRICAITPVFNRRDLTLDCLRTLLESDLEGLELHCIVVDDGSSDGTADAIAEAFPQVEVITGDGTLWYSEGTNVGIRSAMTRSPDYLLLYNNDSRFPRDALQRLVSCAERYPSSLVGAVLVDWDRPERIFQVGTQWQTGFGGWRTWERQTIADLPVGPFAVETIVGNCMFVPSQAIRDCGLMKSAAMPNFGDAELSARMRKAGWRLVIDPSIRVLCQPNDLPKRLSSMTPRQVYDALWSRRTSYHNLKQKAATNAGGAPSRWQGHLATAIHTARLALKPLGLMVSFGNASGPLAPINSQDLASRGSLFFTRPTLFTYTAKREDLVATARDLFDVVLAGKVKIEVNQRYPLKDAGQAQRDLEARKTTGSTVLVP